MIPTPVCTTMTAPPGASPTRDDASPPRPRARCRGWRCPANVGLARGLLVAALMLAQPAPSRADDDGDRAREALRAGEIRPLAQILDVVRQQWQGEVIAVELDREDGQWIYEVKLLAPQGAVIRLEYDARRATLLEAKGRGLDAARRGR